MFDPDSGFWADIWATIRNWFTASSQAPRQMFEFNGHQIELDYLRENIEDARQINWKPTSEAIKITQELHDHCMICGNLIPLEEGKLKYVEEDYPKTWPAMNWFLDEYCYDRFIVAGENPAPK